MGRLATVVPPLRRRDVLSAERPDYSIQRRRGANVFDSLTLLVIFGGVLAAIWYAAQPRPKFVIRIRNGTAEVVRGKTTESMRKTVSDICRQNGVTSGKISGLAHGKRIRLKCSKSIPAGCQQQLRNILLAEL